MEVAAGTVLKGQIVIERELGRGAMGVVWEATHRGLDANVAVKVLHSASLGSDEARARFDREAKSVARIDSPHVVRIFDVGITEHGEPFIVMERLRGRDLKSQLEELGPLSFADTVSVVQQICAALGRAHALGVIHRDLKPANVFLAEGGAGLFVKVLDFGVAKLEVGGLGLTATESLVGTPYYMSPEQFVDARKIDRRSDLWSVAVVAYACLTGTLPFLGESIGALALAVHKGTFAPPSSERAEVTPAIDAWFARALHPDREERFQTAEEVARTFADAVAGQAPAAHVVANERASGTEASQPKQEPSPTEKAGLARSEGPAAFAGTVAASPAATVPDATLGPLARTDSGARDREAKPAPPAPSNPWRTGVLICLTLAAAGAVGYGASRFGASPALPSATSSLTAETPSAATPSSSVTAPVASLSSSGDVTPTVRASASTEPSSPPVRAPAPPARPGVTESELRSLVLSCWASNRPPDAPAGTIRVSVSGGYHRGMSMSGPYAGDGKTIKGAAPFLSCVRAAVIPLEDRVAINPDPNGVGISATSVVSLPGS